MTHTNNTNQGRRAFFLRSSIVAGAGMVSASAGASTFSQDLTIPLQERITQLEHHLSSLEDKEAIQELIHHFLVLLETQQYEALTHLLDDSITIDFPSVKLQGESAKSLFIEDYANETSSQRLSAVKPHAISAPKISLNEERTNAESSIEAKIQFSTPLLRNSTKSDMARMQGLEENHLWKDGLFKVAFSRVDSHWKINKLSCIV